MRVTAGVEQSILLVHRTYNKYPKFSVVDTKTVLYARRKYINGTETPEPYKKTKVSVKYQSRTYVSVRMCDQHKSNEVQC